MPKPGQPVRGSTTGRPIMVLLDLLGRRWTLRILWEMRQGQAMSFRDVQNACDNLSPTVLNKRLHELREADIVILTDGEGFQLTDEGLSLLDALLPLNQWADRWNERVNMD
jgi:DNA-binding HxlR family transcriptional regulator